MSGEESRSLSDKAGIPLEITSVLDDFLYEKKCISALFRKWGMLLLFVTVRSSLKSI